MVRVIPAAVLVAALAGCATQAPSYQASIDNVERLQRAGVKAMQIGPIAAAPDLSTATSISLRGNAMASPVGSGYADYLAAALRQELELARLLDPKSSIEVTAVLLKNDIAAAGISTNSGEVEARFTVRRDGAMRYDAVKRAVLSWDSSFAGAVAIPLAVQNYPRIVQRLLGDLFSDSDFIAACK